MYAILYIPYHHTSTTLLCPYLDTCTNPPSLRVPPQAFPFHQVPTSKLTLLSTKLILQPMILHISSSNPSLHPFSWRGFTQGTTQGAPLGTPGPLPRYSGHLTRIYAGWVGRQSPGAQWGGWKMSKTTWGNAE